MVRDRLTGKKLDTTPARNVDVATGSGRPYWPMQIASFFEEAYGFDLDSRHLTSLVGLDTANALQISVGHSLQSGNLHSSITFFVRLRTVMHNM